MTKKFSPLTLCSAALGIGFTIGVIGNSFREIPEGPYIVNEDNLERRSYTVSFPKYSRNFPLSNVDLKSLDFDNDGNVDALHRDGVAYFINPDYIDHSENKLYIRDYTVEMDKDQVNLATKAVELQKDFAREYFIKKGIYQTE